MSSTHFSATVQIDPSHIIGAINPHLYGANLEHIGRSIYGGAWAEMLQSRKFAGHDRMYIGMSEGLRHQNPSYGIVQPWEAYAPDYERVLYVHDNTTFYTGEQAQRITIRESDSTWHGIQQGALSLHAARAYDLRLVLRGEGQRVQITLDGETREIGATSEWMTYRHTFQASSRNPNGTLRIAIHEGSLWIGCASFMPSDNLDGWRADVVAMIRQLTPTFLRWPGGNFVSGYAWEKSIGDRDQRPSYFDPAWKVWEPNDVGTDEFMHLCQLVGCEPVLTVNMGDGTAEEAASWVEYCNAPADTPWGSWRAQQGHPEPYNVRTWFVGNEQFGNWQVGHCDAETYASRYHEYADLMREADPDLFLIGVGVPTDLYGHWNELVLRGAGTAMDALSVHYYSIRTELWETPPPAGTLYTPKVAAAHEVRQMLDRTLDIIAQYSNPTVPLAFDEWNTYVAGKAPDFFEDYTIADALYVGGVMNHCLRRADRIVMSAIYNFVNVMANIRVTPDALWVTPSALVLQIMTRFRGGQSIAVQVESPTFDSPETGNQPAMYDIPLVDAAATIDANHHTLYLSLVNRDQRQEAHIRIFGIARAGTAALHIVAGDDPLALNTEDDPSRVVVEAGEWAADNDMLVLRPHSFTMMVIPLRLS
jgi:alpha-N-arabinofuranosidase